MKITRWFPVVLAFALPSAAVADDDEKETESESKKQQPAKSKQASHIQAHVVPAIAGIESADKAAAVLYELAGSEQLRPKDAQRAVDLAQQGVTMALDRAAALDNVKGLSSDAKSQAETATAKLREARATLQQLDDDVGAKNLSPAKAASVREQASDLHDDLSDAENAVERIARAYDVPTDLEFGG